MVKSILLGLLVLLLPLRAMAIDADGFFTSRALSGFFGEMSTSSESGILRAIHKQEEGKLLICTSKKRTSKACDSEWVTPSMAVKQLVENSCYLGFEFHVGELVVFYRLNRPCN